MGAGDEARGAVLARGAFASDEERKAGVAAEGMG